MYYPNILCCKDRNSGTHNTCTYIKVIPFCNSILKEITLDALLLLIYLCKLMFCRQIWTIMTYKMVCFLVVILLLLIRKQIVCIPFIYLLYLEIIPLWKSLLSLPINNEVTLYKLQNNNFTFLYYFIHTTQTCPLKFYYFQLCKSSNKKLTHCNVN